MLNYVAELVDRTYRDCGDGNVSISDRKIHLITSCGLLRDL